MTNPPSATLTRFDGVLCILMSGLSKQACVFPRIIREIVFHAGGVVVLSIYFTVWGFAFGNSARFLDVCQITIQVNLN